LEAVLADSLALDKKTYASFAKSRGSIEDVRELLLLSGIALIIHTSYVSSFNCMKLKVINQCVHNLITDKLKSRQATMSMHFKVLAGLTYTDKDKMDLIFDSFKDCFDFLKFDDDPNSDFANKVCK
jgi:hypothetical protein